ncbi:MAG: phosphoglycolate phosphatase [Pseudomonadota bacterium]|nr:phosphoglycolate phosphatase [Pseudomonadota bacterium]
MSLLTPQLVLIDLDGTLIDTVPDLADAVDATLALLGLTPRGEHAVRQWIGNGIERLVKRALTGDMEAEPDEVTFTQALTLFNSIYAECNGRYSALFPGVLEGVTWLKAQGYPCACITNKAEQFTLPLLQALKVDSEFQLVLSGDSLPRKKPDPLPLLHAAQFFQIEPQNALMIGDSINDVQAARAAEFQIICVNYGYNHGEDIRQAQPDAVIDSLAQLPDYIQAQVQLSQAQ